MSGPLNGIKVLSFCRALAGPFTTMILGDMGAEIIKIESPDKGDPARYSGNKIAGVSAYFLSLNRGKKSITLDLKSERSRKLIHSLIETSDVLVENFRPGVMKRLGFDYDTVKKINARLVYASVSGFGQTGPYSQKPAYDMVAQAMGGVISITGCEDPGAPPVRVGYSIGDIAAGMFTATGILAALVERGKSNLGQWVDVSMLDSQVALCENAVVRYTTTGVIPKPQGSRHPLFTPFQVYNTQDKPIAVLANSEKLWINFCRAAEKEEWLSDQRYNPVDHRIENYKQFDSDMTALMRTRSYNEWVDRFEEHEAMYAPVNNIEDVVNDPQVKSREMVIELVHAKAGAHRVVNTPIKFSRTPSKIEKAAPELGADTYDILSRRLGLSDKEINEFALKNVICRPRKH